ncbi:MAG TPA: peptidylprolyl isomerase [Gaiellaceae bacterium]|nr:peptidylprolyl isomerase [Gaiellaceae bacterium]
MTAVLRNRRFLVLFACCAAVALVLAGCGGSSSSSGVPSGDIATVNGQPVTQKQFDAVLVEYQSILVHAKQPQVKKGTSGYDAAVQKLVSYLVTKTELEQQGKKMGIVVTSADVDAEVKTAAKSSFGGSMAKLVAAIEKQGITMAQFRDSEALTVLENKLSDKLTKNLKITDAEALAYYNKNHSQYVTPESRSLEHILVKTKAKAQQIYNKIKAGASFASMAKKYSTDKGSGINGGKLGTAPCAGYVKPFAKVACSIATGVLSQPVHSQFGWHLIEALGPVIPKKVTPFNTAKATIKANLLATKKSDATSKFQSYLTGFYAKKVKYAKDYAPPSATTPPLTSAQP